jgi:hypothetical protein
MDEDAENLKQEVVGEPTCLFNDCSYAQGSHICSGGTLLRCDYGIWLQVGSCDPDNP